MLQVIAKQGQNLQFDFLGRSKDVQVWLVSGPDAWQLVYLREGRDDQAIVGGALIDEKGEDQSIALQQKFVAKHPERTSQLMQKRQQQLKASAAQQEAKKQDLWARLQQSGALMFGEKNKPLIIAFLDPNQPESHQVWQELSQKLQNDEIAVQVRAVAWRDEASIKALAHVLGAKDPQQAWRDVMEGKSPPEKDTGNIEGIMQLKRNADLLQSLHLDMMPVVFYRAQTPQGEKTRLVRGVPKNWASLWAEMLRPIAEDKIAEDKQ